MSSGTGAILAPRTRAEWLAWVWHHVPGEASALVSEVVKVEAPPEIQEPVTQQATQPGEGPPCMTCGGITMRAGSCYCCTSCGTTTGCS